MRKLRPSPTAPPAETGATDPDGGWKIPRLARLLRWVDVILATDGVER